MLLLLLWRLGLVGTRPVVWWGSGRPVLMLVMLMFSVCERKRDVVVPCDVRR